MRTRSRRIELVPMSTKATTRGEAGWDWVMSEGTIRGRARRLFFHHQIVEASAVEKDSGEGLGQALIADGSDGAVRVVLDAMVLYREDIRLEAEEGVAGAWVAVVGPAYTAGVDEPHTVNESCERLVRVAEDDEISRGAFGKLAQAVVGRFGGEGLFVRDGAGVGKEDTPAEEGEAAFLGQ